ncbi:putative VID27-involved in vacuole import and degradation [Violaceomyces palustris]|uniref:VID27-involved in vacuole import and degradation n=1 Tax=Violaceomyces palustris TaxID=1673888 RepID=A0ACD0P4Q3_9BASI|nr:putative VID27-involved in vacuole import and degradation [Violaceomyces palustris]
MFMLKSLFGKIWGDQNNVELIQIPAGALYLVRSESVKGSRECIYKDAVAAIRRTATERNYQLVITRAYEEGEEQLLEEDEESDDERSFLIDEALCFRSSQIEDEPTFVWRDLNGDAEDLLEFVIDSKQVNKVTMSIFEVTFLQCVFERKTGRSHDEASDDDLEKLKWRPSIPGAGESPDEPQLSERFASTSISNAERVPKEEAAIASVVGKEHLKEVLVSEADIYLYDQASGLFLIQEKKVQTVVAEAGRFLFWLAVTGENRQWLSQKIGAAMNMNFSSENLSAVWNYFDDESRCYSWLLRFSDKGAYASFQEGFSRYLWETLHEESWSKAKKDEREYMQNAYEDDDPMPDIDEESSGGNSEDEAERELSRQDENEGDASAESEEADVSEDIEASGWREPEDKLSSAKEVNSQLAVGYKFDRSFVVRGNKIGVFKHTDDNRLEFDTTINKIATPKGKEFRPSKIMLHDQDAAMVLMDPSNQHSVFNMDLEYGKVVEEWKVHDDVQVSNIVPDSKYAQMTTQKTMIGTSHNGIYRIDPRLSGNKMVESQFKQYATKNDFSAAATDSKGRLAVASNKGDIRLFDQIGKNAKTALPALGDPILGIDVTADGRYVIATCKTYLLLIDTLIGSGRYEGQLGFDRSFPADAKPIPKRLTLKPSHVAYMGSEVSFTPARFDTGSNTETSIVTSTGNYVVSWSFSAVKRGNTSSYVLKRYGGSIIQDEHTYGSDQSIVVAFENDVQLANRSQLQKPSRQSLQPRPSRRS